MPPLAHAAQLVPPTAIDPPYNEFEARQEYDLLHDLPDHQYYPPKIVPWPLGTVPAVYHTYPENSDVTLDGSRLEARDVYYSDCDAPWIICRYNDSLIDWDQATMILGKIPVGMRQHVAHVILAPESYSKQKPSIAAETKGATTAFLLSMSLGIAVHEFSHILDAVVGSQRPLKRSLSNSPQWKDFYDNDTKVPTDYAATSPVEDFADAGRWAMSNMARERAQHQNQYLSRDDDGGGRLFFRNRTIRANQLAIYSADWKAWKSQIAGYRTLLEHLIFPGGAKCTAKTCTSVAVNATTGQHVSDHHIQEAMGMGAGSLKSRALGVPEIVPADWAMRVQFPPYVSSQSTSGARPVPPG
ncbi:conidiation-specific protein (con-13) protein [Apiospora rasikravindrae]|uniref:Conidiation-specific protein (Con-13) protein n=1 Tax=Apiospora rasikravindrae TaxID=990691 RepID=A0ABR1SWN4_9PEZI